LFQNKTKVESNKNHREKIQCDEIKIIQKILVRIQEKKNKKPRSCWDGPPGGNRSANLPTDAAKNARCKGTSIIILQKSDS
jgi:hypothetical protein